MKEQIVKVVRITTKGLYKDYIGILKGKTIILESGTSLYANKYKYKIRFELSIKREINIKKRLITSKLTHEKPSPS